MPDRVGVLPIRPRSYLVQGTLAAFLASEISILLLLVLIGAVLTNIPNPGWMFLLLSLYNLFAVSLILAVGSIVKHVGIYSFVVTMIAVLIAMIGGLFWPIEMVPVFMQRLAWFSPGYWFSQGLSNIKDITFDGFVVPSLFLAGFTVVVLLIGGFKQASKMEE
jgi:ABC-2 type transport system permease protein